MKNHYHPSYYRLARDLDNDTIDQKPFIDTFGVYHFKPQRNFRKKLPFLLGGGLLLIGLGYIFGCLLLPLPKEETSTPVKPLVEQPETGALLRDVSLIKNVLRGLVTTVDKLSQQNQTPIESPERKLSEESPSFKISSDKANLRDFPSIDAPTIVTLAKDTILLGIDFRDGWIKTFAPNGKEAWVHGSLVTKVKATP
jgi:hypothetical protein